MRNEKNCLIRSESFKSFFIDNEEKSSTGKYSKKLNKLKITKTNSACPHNDKNHNAKVYIDKLEYVQELLSFKRKSEKSLEMCT